MPTPVLALLSDRYGEWDSRYCLARMRQDGLDGGIETLVVALRRATTPCRREALKQRLTALGMTMSPNRPAAEATMWLRETMRLLADLPQDIVFDAIDHCQRINKFLPTVAEIREIADPWIAERRKQVARLEAMQRLIASGTALPDPRPAPIAEPKQSSRPMTPYEVQEMNSILARIGAVTRYHPDGSRYEVEDKQTARRNLGPPRKPTRQDYLDLGVDPAVLDQQDIAA